MQPLLKLIESGLGGVQALAQIAHFGNQGANVLTPALGRADGLGTGVALVLQLLGLGLQLPALLLQSPKRRCV